MKARFRCIIILLLMGFSALHAQEVQDTLHVREYRFLAGHPYESEIFATNGLTFYKGFQDIYQRGIAPHLPPKLNAVTEILWSINWSFIFTMWPHDGGHWVRARQSGGDFIITRFGYPFPVAEMHLPDDLQPKYQTLSSIGGHEINFLVRKQIHTSYYFKGYTFADELFHGFIQDMFFPLYAFVIAHAKPGDPDVWLDTRGDPVESTLSVYRKYTGREPVNEAGTVDPELIRQYREATITSVIWPILNPMFIQGLKSFGVDLSKDHGLIKGPWMLGGDQFAWSWGTHFNPSPLGYELYFQNYFKISKRLYMLSLKAGRPFKNLGIGVEIPGLVETGSFQLGVSMDAWDQDIYGKGLAFTLNPEYHPPKGLGIILKTGWKSEGYLVGRKVDSSFLVLGGCSYSF